MMKRLKLLFTAGLILVKFNSVAQVKLNGPLCVLSKFDYTYYLEFEGQYSGEYTICIEGGQFVQSKQTCQTLKSHTGFNISWNSDDKTHAINISYTGGKESIKINITEPLEGGEIITSLKKQRLRYDTVAAQINCTKPVGGYCTPAYAFQWEQSIDAINWQDISGAIEPNLSPRGKLKQPIFYRRRVTEKNSGSIAYSSLATVFVDAETRSR